jgi:hypothetical protein
MLFSHILLKSCLLHSRGLHCVFKSSTNKNTTKMKSPAPVFSLLLCAASHLFCNAFVLGGSRRLGGQQTFTRSGTDDLRRMPSQRSEKALLNYQNESQANLFDLSNASDIELDLLLPNLEDWPERRKRVEQELFQTTSKSGTSGEVDTRRGLAIVIAACIVFFVGEFAIDKSFAEQIPRFF